MLHNIQVVRKHWHTVDELVSRWLDERQELLVLFCSISRVRPIHGAIDRHQTQFHRFCEVLVDYVSAGHFEIYEQLVQEAVEFQDGGTELARQLYPIIASTTGVVLDFNDRCLEKRGERQPLARDLSRLGVALEARFEAEDRLIEALHRIHAEAVA